MKIYTAEQIRKADQYTIQHEPVSSIDLMERAAVQAYKWIYKRLRKEDEVHIFCGVGNNGGDGLVIARKLQKKGVSVNVYKVNFSDKPSDDFQANEKRLKKRGIKLIELNEGDTWPEIPSQAVVIDAVFGSGLNRPIKGWLAQLVEHINASGRLKIAIDIPSGLMAESNDQNKGAKVKAHITLSFEFPKLAFFFPSNADVVGHWEVLPIGIHEDFVLNEPTQNFYATEDVVQLLLKSRPKFGHKGTFGHALLMVGSKGKIGAGVLSAKACLRSGAGLLTTAIPNCGYTTMQTAVPEAMCLVDDTEDMLTKSFDVSVYNAVGIGPGIGTDKATYNVVKVLIQNAGRPVVFDADAINIIAENKTWLEFIPQGSVLTPHPGEFARLVGRIGDDYARYEKLKSFAMRYKVYVVLKGAHTAIATPRGEVFFNSTGNVGMATGGSGDVLTGVITGLIAQGYSPGQAAILGVWLHGKAGDIAQNEIGSEALIASDIVAQIGNAYQQLRSNKS